MQNFNIAVIGAGMYVCGRGTDAYGTVMPAIFEWKKEHRSSGVYLTGTTPISAREARRKVTGLKKIMRVDVPVEYFPKSNKAAKKCYKEVFRVIPKPACAIIAVPDNMHREIAGAAIEEGLHTLVVKPLAPTVKEVKELIALQDKNKVYCAVEFHKRFDHANLKLKDCIKEGVIGDPLCFLVEYSQRKNVPFKMFRKWVTGTNIFQYLGIHYVDVIYFATGALPKRVMAIGQKGWLASRGIDVHDSIQGVIEWEMPSGKRFTSHIVTNWIDPEKTSAMSDQKIKVVGTKGRFESDQKKRGITIVTDEKGVEEPNPYFCSAYGAPGAVTYKGYGIDSIKQFLKDVKSIEDGKLNPDDLEGKRPTFKDSLVPTAVLEAINRSLVNNGAWVDIKMANCRYGIKRGAGR